MNQTFDDVQKVVQRLLDVNTAPVVEVDLRVFEEQEEQRISQALTNTGYAVMRVDSSPILNKNMLLYELQRVCKLPDYFGFNWDALLECLVDFSWWPAKGYMLMYKTPEVLGASDLQTFLSIVKEASASWAESGIPLKLVVPQGSIGISIESGK
jgi:hypothetical protein